MDSETVLRELFNARFDALEAKIAAMVSVFEKENDRQDEAIERIADRSTHVSETRRLTERVQKIEGQIDTGRSRLNDHDYKIKVIWAVGGLILGLLLATLGAIIKGWIGV